MSTAPAVKNIILETTIHNQVDKKGIFNKIIYFLVIHKTKGLNQILVISGRSVTITTTLTLYSAGELTELSDPIRTVSEHGLLLYITKVTKIKETTTSVWMNFLLLDNCHNIYVSFLNGTSVELKCYLQCCVCVCVLSLIHIFVFFSLWPKFQNHTVV